MPTVTINGKKHTPGSNTLKKMRKKAAAEKAAKSAEGSTPKSKKRGGDAKPPIPKDRPKKKAPVNIRLPDRGKKNPKDRVDTGQARPKPITQLKGKAPKKGSKKKGHGIAMGQYRLK